MCCALDASEIFSLSLHYIWARYQSPPDFNPERQSFPRDLPPHHESRSSVLSSTGAYNFAAIKRVTKRLELPTEMTRTNALGPWSGGQALFC